jgi:flagellin-like hook-associated protein FlgL
MITNTTLMHIQRNMRNLGDVLRTIESTKRVSTGSDDPLIASRALKFRTNVHENGQFQRNVQGGLAWMNVTEASFTNINAELMAVIRTNAVAGATMTHDISQMQTIITSMYSLFEEIGATINNRFSGQYVFSGFRTDEPPVFTAANQRDFIITQHFSLSDIERGQAIQRLPDDQIAGLFVPTVTENVHVLKLAYANLNTDLTLAADDPPTAISAFTNNFHIPGFQVRQVSVEHPDAYTPDQFAVGTTRLVHLIQETGELVFHPNTAQNLPPEGISVTYRKSGFAQGDINPAVYFDSREIINPQVPVNDPPVTEWVFQATQNFNRQAGNVADIGGVQGRQFPLFYDADLDFLPGAGGPPGLLPNLPPGAQISTDGMTVFIPNTIFDTQRDVSITFSTTVTDATQARALMEDTRFQGMTLVRAQDANGIGIPLDRASGDRSFDMNNQEMRFEFSSNTHVRVNSLAKDVLTAQMFADFRRMMEFSNSIHLNTEAELRRVFENPPFNYQGEQLQRAISDQQTDEESRVKTALHVMFNNMLLNIDRHLAHSTREQTLLGTRMVRLGLVQDRLESDEVTLTALKSANEDTEMFMATALRATAEAAFMASLHANTGIVQMSLAQFIR